MLFVSSESELEPLSDLKAKRDIDVRDFWYFVFKYRRADVPVLFFHSRHKVTIAEHKDEKHSSAEGCIQSPTLISFHYSK